MHLIILLHGMWGKAADFNYMCEQLASKGFAHFSRPATPRLELTPNEIAQFQQAGGVVYTTHSNEGYFTYDGIDICGVRVADEIVEVLRTLHAASVDVTALSIVGYSMGGLMARCAIGVLESRGVFCERGGFAGHPRISPKVFVTTCSPHLGVNVLSPSLAARIFNFIGSWSMARTSRQAFLCDHMPQPQPLTTKSAADAADAADAAELHGQGLSSRSPPLFLQLTQPDTIWTRALARFERRILYANVTNDRRCEFYTASATGSDPYKPRDLGRLKGPYVPGYEPIVMPAGPPQFVDPHERHPHRPEPAPAHGPEQTPAPRQRKRPWWLSWLRLRAVRLYRWAYLAVRLGVVMPLWFGAFLVNATFQGLASTLRTRNHARLGGLEQRIEQRLETSAESLVEQMYRTVEGDVPSGNTSESGESGDSSDSSESTPLLAKQGALPLTPVMRRIVAHFDKLGFEKYYLSILTTPMAHAAAIMKLERPEWYEGKAAVQHLVDALASTKRLEV